jgi:hypothetical protein
MEQNATSMNGPLSHYDQAETASQQAVESMYADLPTGTSADQGIRAGLADIKQAESGYRGILQAVQQATDGTAANNQFLQYVSGEKAIQSAFEAVGIPAADLTVN